jgi:hypothetical protein
MTGRMIVGFATTYAINVYHHLNCDSNPDHGEVYLMQYYVIKLVNGWFSQGTPLSCINKTDGYDITEILLNVALNTISQPSIYGGRHGHDRLVPVVGFIFMYLPYVFYHKFKRKSYDRKLNQ